MTHHELLAKAFQWFLAAGCKTYSKTKDEILASVKVYAELLKYYQVDTLQAACRRCAETCKDFPAVADIRAAAEQVKAERRAELRASGDQGALEKRANPECEFCGGSGMEERTLERRTWVRRCRCLSPGYIAPPAKPRKMLTAADRAEFAEVLKR